MRISCLHLLFLLFSCILNAQGYENCAVLVQNETLNEKEYSKSASSRVLGAFEPITFNIFFWGIREDNGTGNENFRLENIENAIQSLNTVYEKGNISFQLSGFDFIDSSDFTNLQNSTEFFDLYDYIIKNNLIKDDSFNIYVSSEYQNFAGVAYRAYEKIVGIPAQHLLEPGVLAHEIGHCFNLAHTNNGFDKNYCESATRDPNNIYYNADTNGDFVTDTEATYNFSNNDFDASNCTYIGNTTDCYGIRYEIPEQILRNYMTTNAPNCIKTIMTTGQLIRAQETIILDPVGAFEAAKID